MAAPASVLSPASAGESRAPGAAPLSPSQVSLYLNCETAWYYKYRLGLTEAPTGALALGKAVHTAVLAAAAVQTRNDTPRLDEVLDCFDAALQDELALSELRSDEDAGQLQQQGRAMVSHYQQHIAPGLTPAAVEIPVDGSIAGVPVRGRIDLLTTTGEVIDLKTASRKPTGINAAQQLQLTTYGLLHGTDRTRVISLVKTKEPASYNLPFVISGNSVEYANRLYPAVQEAMESGLYLPRRNSTLCSRKQCAYWRQCEADYGGKVSE